MTEQRRGELLASLHDRLQGTDADIAYGHMRHIINEWEALSTQALAASWVEEIKPCPYVNTSLSKNDGVSYMLRTYPYYSDFVLFSEGKPDRCFRIYTLRQPTNTQAGAVDAYRLALEEIREEWAGSDCGQPVYAQEAYAINLAKRMYLIAVEALRQPTNASEG